MPVLRALPALIVLMAGPAAGAPRLAVCVPKGGAALAPEVQRAFSWATPTIVVPDSIAQRYPPSAESGAIAEDERRALELLRAAEADFLALRFDDATARIEDCAKRIDRLPPSVRREAVYVRLQLLSGRVGAARKDPRAALAFAAAAEAAVEVELDEAEYPPEVRQAYAAARAAARARPRRELELASEPAGAEIEVNGQLAGRTPAKVTLPPGRCLLSITRPGHTPHLAACPSEPRATVTLQPATRVELGDQLRERIASDPAWSLDPIVLDMLAAVEEVRWVVVLERDRGRGLKAQLFSAAEHAFRPIDPGRFADDEIARLSAVVRDLVLRAQRLEVAAVETASGVPALEVRAADPSWQSAAAFVRRTGGGDFRRLGLSPLGGGRFSAGLPPWLSEEGTWDVEYYVKAYDPSGAAAGAAGEPATPLRFRRLGAAPLGAAGRGSRWYLWTALGIVAASAAATGIYLGARSEDVSVRFGAPR